MLTVFWSMYY